MVHLFNHFWVLTLCQPLCWYYLGNFTIWTWLIQPPLPLHIPIWLSAPQPPGTSFLWASVLGCPLSSWSWQMLLPLSGTLFAPVHLPTFYLLLVLLPWEGCPALYVWIRYCALDLLSISHTSPVISFLRCIEGFLSLLNCQFREGRDYYMLFMEVSSTLHHWVPVSGTWLVYNKKYCWVYKYLISTRSKSQRQAVWRGIQKVKQAYSLVGWLDVCVEIIIQSKM